MIRRFALVAVLCLATASANAWLIGKPLNGYRGPGDFVSFTAWWGLRGYSAAVAATGTQKAVQLRRASDSTTSDIVILTSGDLDVASATTFCNATSCFAAIVYDQTAGNACSAASCDVVQATANKQPLFVFNCNGALPCLRTADASIRTTGLLAANNFTPTTPAVTTVGNVVSSSASLFFTRVNGGGNSAQSRDGIIHSTVNTVSLNGATGTIGVSGTDGTWQSAAGNINSTGNTSVLNVGGTESTDTAVDASIFAAPPDVIWLPQFQAGTLEWGEGGFQDATQWSSGIRTALCHNQRVYWSTAGTC